MRLLSSVVILSLAATMACKTNTSPDAQSDPSGGNAGLAVAGGSEGGAEMATKAAPATSDVVASDGALSYKASGGRSPFEQISCSLEWGAGGAGASATAAVTPRGGEAVERSSKLTVAELELALGQVLVADPMAFPKEYPSSRATDMHTYDLKFVMMGNKHKVESYGLAKDSPLGEMINALDGVCGTKTVIDEIRSR